MTIRVLEQENADYDALSRLHAEGFDPPWSAAAISTLLPGAGCFGYFAGSYASPEGFIIARVAADEAEVLTLAVSRKERRRGLGRALVAAAADRAQQQGARSMFLEVDASNTVARNLYEGAGFVVVGNRAAYYESAGKPSRDALVLKSALPLDGK